MRIGETFFYKVGNETRIIRKEKDCYITYVLEESSFFELDDFLFQIIKYTINNIIHLLIEKTSKNYGLFCKQGQESNKCYSKKISQKASS